MGSRIIKRSSAGHFLTDIERQWDLLRRYGAELGYDVDALLAEAVKAHDTGKRSEVDLKVLVDEEMKYL